VGEPTPVATPAPAPAPADDDRVRVPSTTAYPYSAVCRLLITFPARPGVTYQGTGVLVDASHVLTAAHNFYAHDLGGFAATIDVIPGGDGPSRPFGTARSLLMTTFRGWTDRAKPNWDIGWLTLDRPVGASTGWVCPAYVARPGLLGAFVEMPGYPVDLEGDVMYACEGFVERHTVQMLRYPFTTAPGQSGSPLLTDRGGRPVVVGVHRDRNVRTGQAWGVWIDAQKLGRIRNFLGDCP
jgi:V8-like Glu-specific endopeptidase